MSSYNEVLETKKRVLSSLPVGTIVDIASGKQFKLKKVNRTRFIGEDLITGQDYTIPITMFVDVISTPEDKAPTNTKSNVQASTTVDFSKIYNGDYIYIVNSRQDALLIRFEEINDNGYVIGSNPYNGVKYSFSPSAVKGTVQDLLLA